MGKINHGDIRPFTVETTAKKVLDAKKNRKAVLIYNNGASPVELLSSPKQIYGQGIPILAGAEYDSDHFNPQGDYWIICETGTEDIRIEETIQSA